MQNFTLAEQAKVIVAARSNNELDMSKMKKEFPTILGIKESLIKYVFEPNKKALEAQKANGGPLKVIPAPTPDFSRK
jgi:hypothetical protein